MVIELHNVATASVQTTNYTQNH